MLERTSRFVLEVVPYLLTALIAAILLPGFLFAQVHGPKSVAVPYIHDAVFASDQTPSDTPTYR